MTLEYYEEELSPVPKKVKPRVTLEKPYLISSDLRGDPKKEVIILEWMDFLLSKTNLEGVLDALSYYVDLGWISDDVKNGILTYTRGFARTRKRFFEIKVGDRKYEVGEETPPKSAETVGAGRLDPEDHLHSLSYILELSDRVGREAREEMIKRAGLKREIPE
jgi:archaellum component FlaD/FlaE